MASIWKRGWHIVCVSASLETTDDKQLSSCWNFATDKSHQLLLDGVRFSYISRCDEVQFEISFYPISHHKQGVKYLHHDWVGNHFIAKDGVRQFFIHSQFGIIN